MGRLIAQCLGLAALGDVLEDADEALRLAVLCVDEPAEGRQPARFAVVGAEDAVFGGIARAVAFRLLDCPPNPLPIVRVDALAPHLPRGLPARRGLVTEDPEVGVGPDRLARLEVHVPGAHPRAVDGQAQPLLARAQRLLRQLAFRDVLDGEEDQRWAAYAVQPAGVEEHGFLTDLGEVMLNLEALEGVLVG